MKVGYRIDENTSHKFGFSISYPTTPEKTKAINDYLNIEQYDNKLRQLFKEEKDAMNRRMDYAYKTKILLATKATEAHRSLYPEDFI